MKRLLILLAALLLVGCAPAEPKPTTYSSTSEALTLSYVPKRTAVLFSSLAEVWLMAGGTVYVTVGESVERGFASEDTVLVDSGAGKTIDVEALLAAKPDFVIGSADVPAQVQACTAAKNAGIPAVTVRMDTLEDYLEALRLFTNITGNTEAYEVFGRQIETEVTDVLAQLPEASQKKILFIRAGSTASATKAKRAPENFVCTMLQELGTHNIADDAPVLLDGLSLEHILVSQPDYIFISTMGDESAAKAYITELFAQDGWNTLTAVQEGNWAFLPRELFHFKPNGRWAAAYWHLAHLLHPELEDRYVYVPELK